MHRCVSGELAVQNCERRRPWFEHRRQLREQFRRILPPHLVENPSPFGELFAVSFVEILGAQKRDQSFYLISDMGQDLNA